MPRNFAHKIDGNHAAIVKALRAAGVYVVSLAALGNGVPDLLCSYNGRGVRMMALMEVKLPHSPYLRGGKGGKRERQSHDMDPQAGFTDAEKKFHAEWPGPPIFTVRSEAEALGVFGL